MPDKASEVPSRYQRLPLFQPHAPTFTCEIETTKVPTIDAQSEAWFLEARELENPEIYYGDRDYKKIVQLTRQAADRHHWKAMLNLASFYIEGRDQPNGVEEAVQLVEEAMQLGIPAAYDRMGTYFMNGTGVEADASRAYAFWQKAAQMGNPHAMTFLGNTLNTNGEFAGTWRNFPVGIKMLECALGQGHGPAAFELAYIYQSPRSANGTIVGPRNSETKSRALKALHEGVTLGCEMCAGKLFVEFGAPFDRSRPAEWCRSRDSWEAGLPLS